LLKAQRHTQRHYVRGYFGDDILQVG